MEHLLRCPPILWHPALDSDQLDLQEKLNTANSEFSADVTVPPSLNPSHKFLGSLKIARPQILKKRAIEPNANRNRQKIPSESERAVMIDRTRRGSGQRRGRGMVLTSATAETMP